MRYLYSFLFYLALPFVYIRLFLRSRKVPGYRERIKERCGFYDFTLQQCIWVHAVSMGESIAAIPLIKSLLALYPHKTLLVTSMTPTGAERIKATFGESVKQAYLPYDLPFAMQRFVNAMHPEVAIIMETELWPNLIEQCYRHHIPVCLVNARLSEKSARGYGRARSLTKDMLSKLNLIAAHGEPDAKRFMQLGAAPEIVKVTGNIKFDLDIPADLQTKSAALRQALGQDRFIWIAASTHEGEEDIVLAIHQMIRAENPNALLILVPRHPDRFDDIAIMSQALFETKRRSLGEVCDVNTAVYLGDTMGELLLMYSVCDVAFVGGSLISRGGHNMLEPGALGKPILVGEHLFNFKEISDMFFAAGGAFKAKDKEALGSYLKELMHNVNARRDMGQKAFQVIEANRGALAKQLDLLKGYISS